MKKSTKLGGTILAVGLIIGAMFSFGPGLGTGDDGNDGDTLVSMSETIPPMPNTEPTEENLRIPEGVLNILIDDRTYFVEKMDADGKQFAPVELEELIELSKKSKPNAEGIRINVSRKKKARATAEEQLQQALSEAGLLETSIHWSEILAE